MKTNPKNYLVLLIPLGLLLLISIISYLGSRIGAIPENPTDLAGNTAGNLYNGGSFCEQDDIVYFSNPYDGGSIYAMNPDQSNIHKVMTANATFLNVAGSYIYYYSASSAGQSGLGYVRDGRGLYRADTEGKKNIMLTALTSDSLLVLGNCLFYTDFTQDSENPSAAVVTMNGMTTEGENDTLLVPDHVKLGAADGTSLFYAGVSADHYLYELDMQTGSITQISTLNMYEPVVEGNLVYYLDMDDDLSLKVWSRSDNSIRTISAERIESYNLYGDMIYYQTVDSSGGDDYAFKRIRTDGSGEETIKEGVVKDIQITSSYVYFRDYNTDMPIYQVPTFGGAQISTFQAAADAVALP